MSAHNFRRLEVEPFEGRVVPSAVPAPPSFPWPAADVGVVSPREDAADHRGVSDDRLVEAMRNIMTGRLDRPAGGEFRGPPDREAINKLRSVAADLGPGVGSFAAEIRDRVLSGAVPPSAGPAFPFSSAPDIALIRYTLPPAGTRTVWQPNDAPTTSTPSPETWSPPAAGDAPTDPRSEAREVTSQSVGPAAVFAPSVAPAPTRPRDGGEPPAADTPPESVTPPAESAPPSAVEAALQTALTWAVPLAGEWPLDPAAVGGAVELIGQLADLRLELPTDAFLDDSDVWLGGVAVTAGAAGYGLFLRPPRSRPAAGRLGFDSVRAPWDDHDPNR